MEVKKDYCAIKTKNNFYVYDFINSTISECSLIVYTILNQLEYNDIKYVVLKKIRSKIGELSSYSDEQITDAIAQIKNICRKIENTKKRFSLFEYPFYTRKDILENLAKTRQIVIEITDKCNLKCTYCCYGELYNKEKRNSYLKTENNLSLEYLKTLINLKKLFGTLDSQELIITFYGGEPLLEIENIKKIIREISRIFPSTLKVQYTLTTNGLLLDKCMDFLAEQNFMVYISLDGNKNHNVYRKLKDGRESFERIEKNILLLKEKYPVFFDNKVFFLTVLHNQNNCVDACKYFEKFEKFPMFSPLSEENVNPKNRNKFEMIKQVKKYDSIETNAIKEIYPEIYQKYMGDKEYIESYLKIKRLNDISSIFEKSPKIYPGQSCLPFQNRVFVTTNGTLYLCERSSRKYPFGKITNGKIAIYQKRINDYYKAILSRFSGNCLQCYKRLGCDKCFFQESDHFGNENCRKHLSETMSELTNLITSNETEL